MVVTMQMFQKLFLAVLLALFLLPCMPALAQNEIMQVIRRNYERRQLDWFQQKFGLGAAPRPAPQQQIMRPAPKKRVARTSPFAAPRPAQEVKEPETPAVPPSIFVAVIGDSMAEMLADGLKTQLADRKDIAVTAQTKSSSGLVRTDYYDWPKAAADLLASGQKLDAVVVMMGANDRQQLREGENTLDPRSDEWKTAYQRRIDSLLAPIRAAGVRIYWVGLPAMKNDKLTADVVWFNEIYRERVEAAGGTYLDIWDSFVDADGAYSATGPDLTGQVTKLRAGDGVHFSKAGALVAAHYPERELRRAFGDAPIAAAPTLTSPLAPDAAMPSPGDSAITPSEPGEEPEKPEYGPVMPLEAVETSPGGVLLGNGVPVGPSAVASTSPVTAAGTPPAADPSAAKVLKRGEPLTPREGRADDFRWQRVTPTPEPVKTSSRPPGPGAEMP
jgi:uncharacterized protein